MWANLHLLFWLSLVPFVTVWAGENHFAASPVLMYGFVLMMCGVAYYILVLSILGHHGKDSPIAKAVGNDFKGKISVVLYLLSMLIAIWMPLVSCAIYVLVAIIWLVPDRRMEKAIGQ